MFVLNAIKAAMQDNHWLLLPLRTTLSEQQDVCMFTLQSRQRTVSQ
jgi:hypothetical protein